MTLAIITLLAGLAISAVAIYYSVIGLAAIFAAAVIPIIIMGTILECSKLVAAWWLKKNWRRAPLFLKSYMLLAVIVLMFITSMGIFGFLSKAHVEQGVPTGDIVAQIESYDEQIALEQRIIQQSKDSIKILDDQIMQYTEMGYVTKGVKARKEQKEERDFLNATIRESQSTVTELRRAKLPLSGDLRAVEAEVGPVKYIAQLIYGDNPDSTLLEKAVVWVIITLVFVFDPLAILLLLAAQLSFQWYREEKEKNEPIKTIPQAQTPIAPVEEVDAPEAPEDTLPNKDESENPTDNEDVPLSAEFRPHSRGFESAVQHNEHAYLREGFGSYPKLNPLVHKKDLTESAEEAIVSTTVNEELEESGQEETNPNTVEADNAEISAEDVTTNNIENTNIDIIEKDKDYTFTSEEPVIEADQKDELIEKQNLEEKDDVLEQPETAASEVKKKTQ